jgi:hypothetical protein
VVVHTRGLLDFDAFLIFDRLEVTELVEPLDAVFQRFGVEHAPFDQRHFTADDRVVGRRVAEKGEAVDEILTALQQAHGDVDDRRSGRRLLRRLERVWRLEGRGDLPIPGGHVGISRELVVAARAVDLACLLQSLPDLLLAVVLALLQPEQRQQRLGFHRGVAGQRNRADAVLLPFRHRHVEFDPSRLAVGRLAHRAQLRYADRGRDVAVIAVVLLNLVRVLIECRFLIGARAAQERGLPPRALPVGLDLCPQHAVADRFVPGKGDLADLHARSLVQRERQVHQLRTARHLGDRVRHRRSLESLLEQQIPNHALDLADQAAVDERVEPDVRVQLLQLLVDLRRLDRLRSGVVDDLDPLALLEIERDVLADDAVAVRDVGDVDPQVVEEPGVPQPLEIVERGLHVVRGPDLLRGTARLRVHVVQVGLRIDDRQIALGRERDLDDPDERRRAGRRLIRGRRVLGGRGDGQCEQRGSNHPV